MLDHQALHRVFMTYQQALNHPVRTFTIGGRLFDFNRYRYLVGVINLSYVITGSTTFRWSCSTLFC